MKCSLSHANLVNQFTFLYFNVCNTEDFTVDK